MRLLTDPIVWTYIILVSIANVLAKEDEEKAKRRFIILTVLFGAGESLMENNPAILVLISTIVTCLCICWVKREERKKD